MYNLQKIRGHTLSYAKLRHQLNILLNFLDILRKGYSSIIASVAANSNRGSMDTSLESLLPHVGRGHRMVVRSVHQ